MIVGGIITASPGDIRDMVLDTQLDYVGGASLRAHELFVLEYTNKYYAPFVNGVYTGRNWFVATGNPLDLICPVDPNTDAASFYLEDAGDWPAFDDFIPVGGAEELDLITAQKLQIDWVGNDYTLSTVRGDNVTPQLTNIVITGAKRGFNVAESILPTRGKLTYQIYLVGGTGGSGAVGRGGFGYGAASFGGGIDEGTDPTVIVRWWNATTLVAEGSISGAGTVNCVEMNGSGLSVSCVLNYVNDVPPGQAFVEIRWPASYQIHYSTSPLVFPRTPEATQVDLGKDLYTYLTAALTPGTYHFNVLPVDDDGDVEDAGFPTTTDQTINTIPAAPTITSVTGTAAALTVNWTVGESGCTFDVYASLINSPVNFGNFATPAPISTALNATSAVLAAVANAPGKIRIVVRATKAGQQEHNDVAYIVEFAADGSIIYPRPNRSSVLGMTITGGLTLAVDGMVIDTDSLATADRLDLYVQASGDILITGASWAAGVATLTAVGHKFIVGQTVTVSGIEPEGYGGNVVITAKTANTFSYAVTVDPGAYISGGQATLAFLYVGTAQQSGTLPSPINGVQRLTLSYTVSAAGWYHVAVNSRVNATGSRCRMYNEYAVYLDGTTPPALPTTPTAKVIRGVGP